LACVLYEMLVGRPPLAAPTPQATIARRLTEPAPSLRPERDVPETLDRAVRRALSPVPADRFVDMASFAKALEQTAAETYPGGKKRMYTLGIPAAVVIAVAFVVMWPPDVGGRSLDPDLHVVVPFATEGSPSAGDLDGSAAARYLARSMSFWRDVRLIDPLRVSDAVDRHGSPGTLREALAIARELGAGQLIWGDLWSRGDSLEIRAGLYDAENGREIRRATLVMSAEVTNAPLIFDALSDSLALGTPRARAATLGARGTHLRDAFLRYENGHAALGEWNLEVAQEEFHHAVQLDPDYSQAALWTAQTMAWSGHAPEEWRTPVTLAMRRRDRLDAREARLGAGLLALADARYPAACEEYGKLLEADTTDFAAWYGLGDCHMADPIVQRDARSPSGWSFRGSWHTAITAYAQAMKLLPSFHRAQRSVSPLPVDLFPIEPRVFRRGFAVTPDTVRFAAEPGLVSDTLSLVPYPAADISAGRTGVSPQSNAAAIAWSRRHLRDVATSWVRAFPRSALAREALGMAWESDGNASSALTEIQEARRLAEREQAARLAATATRLMLKNGQWAAARSLADSASGAVPADSASIEDASYLAGLAALVGRVQRTRAFMQRLGDDSTRVLFSRGEPVVVPAAVARASGALLAQASFPAPRDSVLAMMRRMEQQVRALVSPSRREEVLGLVLSLPTTFAYWQLPPSSVLRINAPTALHRMQRAHARGDTAAVRAIADSSRARRDARGVASRLIDFMYHEALVLLAVGDTAAAVMLLDDALEALPAASQILLTDVHRAAAIPLAMHLRARLAARAGDTMVARRWAQGALTLWQDADPALRAVLDDIRPLVQSR
jgi:tetratricopeptide (TPR) repeat protein